MKKVLVIGIGAGDPDHVTHQAVRALNEADVFFALDKGSGKEDLAALRQEICDRFVPGNGYRVVHVADPERRLRDGSYQADVRAWHDQRLDLYQGLLGGLADHEVGAFLVWGDPALYDSTLRILDQLRERGTEPFTVEVVPGISSVQVLAARFGIALHGIGAPVRITTGRLLAEGWPEGADDVVVMLDGSGAFNTLDPTGLDIYWGAYLGTPDEILISGSLADVAVDITRVRAEARARKGWMFDTYLLRRRAER